METDTITAGPSPANLILLFTLAALAVMMLLEALLPRRQLGQNMLWRWSDNFSLASLTWSVSALCSAVVVLYLAKWTGDRQFGLIPYLGAGPAASGGVTDQQAPWVTGDSAGHSTRNSISSAMNCQ